ncbi:hypothetical protein San01_16860 [Streptomyces angustmyceticus]|uniref:Uncharacterized protein n=1 Tax=Streptomyces angustmyceticus TaxID=285578 RepID=A0A5J4LC92_9ACTN|nr:hypothetical protein San01_16860 [Streptomyces angustmyceticus]
MGRDRARTGRGGHPPAGSRAEVVERIVEYHRLVGIEEFVLCGHPHVEEAYWFGEGCCRCRGTPGLWWHPSAREGVHPGAAQVRSPPGWAAGPRRLRPIRPIRLRRGSAHDSLS